MTPPPRAVIDTDQGRVVLVKRRKRGFDVLFLVDPADQESGIFVGMIVLEEGGWPRGGWWPVATGEPVRLPMRPDDSPPPYPRAHDAITFLAGVGAVRHANKEGSDA